MTRSESDGPPIPESDLAARFYRDCYQQVFNDQGFVGWSYRKTHRAVEAGHLQDRQSEILEIGAGTGEHLSFVSNSFARYVMVDLTPEPDNPRWQGDKRVSWVQGDVSAPILEGEQFDRVISMCVLHHLRDTEAALRNIREWLKPGGTFTFFLPSDPGFLNRLNRSLFVAPRARRLGFEHYPVVNAREHHNHYWGLKEELLYEFRDFDVRRTYWPFGIPAADLSVYSVWNVTKPRVVTAGVAKDQS